MSGIDIRIQKLFAARKNLVISAIDHVLEYGDQAGLENPEKAIENCRGTDALLMSRFTLKRYGRFFGGPGAPVPVIRINWSSSFYYPLGYSRGYTRIATEVDEAVEAGGEIVICSLFLENGNEEMETENVRVFSEVVRQKERLGIPLIGECYVVEHKDLTPEGLQNKVKRVTRVMAELGADLIKCFYTGDGFKEVVDNLPVPAFTIGADKLNSDLAVLQKAKDSVDRGARGIIFGRNIFMAKNPKNIIAGLDAVINGGTSPEDAAKRFGLE
ncbi:MAG: hypothetical protein E4H36_11805 [Spirochaetales bacterium]|nr:MAG: hypothetical protein E4H36_11805 [Spirochaetales bacterium]